MTYKNSGFNGNPIKQENIKVEAIQYEVGGDSVAVILKNLDYDELENHFGANFFDSAFALPLLDKLIPTYKGIEKTSYAELYQFFLILERSICIQRYPGWKQESFQPAYVFKTEIFGRESNKISKKYVVEVDPWTQKMVDLVVNFFHTQFDENSREVTFELNVAYSFYTAPGWGNPGGGV